MEEGGKKEGNEKGEEGKGVEELKRMMERMWEEQKKGREVVKGYTKRMEGMMEEIRKEQRERERKWKEERRELLDKLEKVEGRLEKLEKKGEEKKREEGSREGGEMEERVKRMERGWEERERRERRKNIIVRGLVVREGKGKEAWEELMKVIGVEGKMEEMRKVGGTRDKEIWLVRLESEEQKREVMIRKRFLKGRKEKLMDDLTWKERRTRWKLEEIARREGGKGRRVWVGHGKIRIDGEWWI